MDKILHTSYIELCDHRFISGGTLPSDRSVVHCHLDEIVELFRLIEKYGGDSKYILVSSNSDYCLSYQKEATAESKMKRWLKFISTDNLGYNFMVIPARCNIEECRISDEYAIEMYSWIKNTFDSIPKNIVKWFCTNVNIDSDLVTPIPFGYPLWSSHLINTKQKTKTLYVNMMPNTIERASLMSYYKNMAHNNLVCEREVPHERYCDMLAQSKFVLASRGNGMDQYRVLEAIYSHCIPIVEKSRWVKAYENLPVLPVDNLYINIDELDSIYDELYNSANWNFTNTRADLNFWESEIRSELAKI